MGSTNWSDSRSGSSGTGTALDFVAPGDGLTTASQSPTGDFFWILAGTSASAPIASGIAALLKAENPTLSPADVYDLLKAGAEDQVGWVVEDTPGWDPYYGHGRLNAYRSLSALCSCTGGELLRASPAAVGAGGSQVFNLAAGPDNAGMFYLLLGSISGTSPGQTVGQQMLPLNADDYFRLTHSHPNAGALVGTMGVLDGNGEASAQVLLPNQLPASVTGLEVNHAYLLMDRKHPGEIVLMSNPVSLVVDG
jgi:hypothetical protein